jgi:solute carrier family 6 (neurotransmitter transporter, glycine) member 5/9
MLRMPVSQLWSILFFLMLLTLGIDSQFASVENVFTAILDQFPRLRKRKSWVILIICIVFFLLGLPLCFQVAEGDAESRLILRCCRAAFTSST